jgi:hypothetical protein
VLRALSRRSTPATATQIWRAADTGTLAGVHRACARLVEHGLVTSDEVGGRVVYLLNDRHVLHPAAMALLEVDGALFRRMTDHIAGWAVQPVTAAVFGSAARRDGDTGSDVDLLLVRPARLAAPDRRVWAAQVRDLTSAVHDWTGNRLQVLDRARTAMRTLARRGDPLIHALSDESVRLQGVDVDDLVGDLL